MPDTSKMSADEYKAFVYAQATGKAKERGNRTRCEGCGWPLYDSVKDGCTPGNCSQRPLPPKSQGESMGEPIEKCDHCGWKKGLGHASWCCEVAPNPVGQIDQSSQEFKPGQTVWHKQSHGHYEVLGAHGRDLWLKDQHGRQDVYGVDFFTAIDPNHPVKPALKFKVGDAVLLTGRIAEVDAKDGKLPYLVKVDSDAHLTDWFPESNLRQ